MEKSAQRHEIPDRTEAAVTVAIARQSRSRFSQLRFHSGGTLGFLLYGYLGHTPWALVIGYVSLALAVWDLAMFAAIHSGENRAEVEKNLAARAVVRRSQP